MNRQNGTFSYTYSAKQQEEVKRIRREYLPSEESKLDRLRKLNEGTKRPGLVASLALGTVSSLIMGTGMCCTMIWTNFFALGIVVGIIGMAGIALAYPLYLSMAKRQRAKIAPEIIRLSNELLEENK